MNDRTIECRFCARKYERDELTSREIDAMEHGEPCASDDCPGRKEQEEYLASWQAEFNRTTHCGGDV